MEDRLQCPYSCDRGLEVPLELSFRPPVPPDLMSPCCIEAVPIPLQNPDLTTPRLSMPSFSLYLASEDR